MSMKFHVKGKHCVFCANWQGGFPNVRKIGGGVYEVFDVDERRTCCAYLGSQTFRAQHRCPKFRKREGFEESL